ncbi:MAG: flagellin [Bdellovibrionia bacterium]
MGIVISTNVQSLVAQRFLNASTAAQKETLEHIASGSRINKSADDAAGLAISEKMKGQIRSIRQDIKNASDGVSMIQTAEGGMNEISNILVRFRELAIQSASDTIGDTERGFIDKEITQLKQEIVRISTSTEYNGMKLLSGNGNNIDVQIGTHNNPDEDRFAIDTNKTDVSLGKLGLTGLSVATKEGAREALSTIDGSVNTLIENRAELGSLQTRLQSAVNTLRVYDENLSSANSRIRDADMAQEAADLAKNNILAQAGTSVLSQANQSNMLALKLIS